MKLIKFRMLMNENVTFNFCSWLERWKNEDRFSTKRFVTYFGTNRTFYQLLFQSYLYHYNQQNQVWSNESDVSNTLQEKFLPISGNVLQWYYWTLVKLSNFEDWRPTFWQSHSTFFMKTSSNCCSTVQCGNYEILRGRHYFFAKILWKQFFSSECRPGRVIELLQLA